MTRPGGGVSRPSPRRSPAARAAALALVAGLCGVVATACLGSSQREEAEALRNLRVELCVDNQHRLPATIRFYRDGDPVGPPVQASAFARSCRSTRLAEMLGSLVVEVDPVGPAGTYFPESLRGVLVGRAAYRVEVTLVDEGIELYGQSSYRIWND